MSRAELHSFFIELLETVSAARIAETTGYSQSAVSQVKHGVYGNRQGDDTIFLQAVFAMFGKWHCPALEAEVQREQCLAEMAKPYSVSRLRQWAVCQQCERRKP